MHLDATSVVSELPVHECSIDAETNAGACGEALKGNPLLPGVLVLAAGEPAHVVSRSRYHELISGPFGREVFLRRPVSEMCKYLRRPMLKVPAETTIHEAARVALHRAESPLHEPLVIEFSPGRWALLDLAVLLQAQSTVLGGQIEAHARAVASARDAEAKYRAIFENAVEGLYQATPEGQFLSVNPRLAQIFGYDSPEAMLGEATGSSRYLDADRRRQFLDELSSRRPVHEFESRVTRRDGTVVWISESARHVVDPDGGPGHVEGSITDVTARKTAEVEREELQRRFADASREAGKAEIASGILHNVGNVLNSVNISTRAIVSVLRESKVGGLGKAAEMIAGHQDDLPAFLTTDERGRRLPGYLSKLAKLLGDEQAVVMEEIQNLSRGIEHIKEVVNLQQSYARGVSVRESVRPDELFEDAVRVKLASFERHRIDLVRNFQPTGPLPLDKHKVLQILINLISNAKDAVKASGGEGKRITLRLETYSEADAPWLRYQVLDNGVGIPPENMARIFGHGFTTRKDGHGFGLHSSALAASEMGGRLFASSDGPGKGACFTLELPVAQTAAEVTA